MKIMLSKNILTLRPAMYSYIRIALYIFLSIILFTVFACTSKNKIDYERINLFKTQVVSFVDKEVSPRFKFALELLNEHLARIYNRTDALLSDIVGDPIEQKKNYKSLAERCPEAISPIDNASSQTGISPNYLLILAYQESSCNPKAKASSSSAVGMFQFVEQTWLISIKKYGGKYGYQKNANAIFLSGSNRIKMKDTALRKETLDLRYDPQLSAVLAAELAVENAQYLKRKVRRKLSSTDLYLAHFLGAYGASKFLIALEDNPQTRGTALFPTAAKSNRAIFYSRKSGRARSLDDIYSFFEEKINIST